MSNNIVSYHLCVLSSEFLLTGSACVVPTAGIAWEGGGGTGPEYNSTKDGH